MEFECGSAKYGELHDMSNPRLARGRNRMSLQLGGVFAVAGQQKQLRATCEERTESLLLREVPTDAGDARQHRPPAGIPDERARRHTRVREQPQDLTSDEAGAPSDENHDANPPWSDGCGDRLTGVAPHGTCETL
jgi:hypothetical protein